MYDFFDDFNSSYWATCENHYGEAFKLLEKGVEQFVDYPLILSELEEYNLGILKINQTKRYSYDHQPNGNISTGLTSFLQAIGNSYEVSLSIAKLVENVVSNVFFYHNRNILYLRMNSYNPSDNEDTFEISRWHFDLLSFREYPYKIAITLKGPKTLFVKLPFNIREEFIIMQEYVDSRNHSEVRLKSANLIKECINNKSCVLHQAMHKQATVFSIGNQSFAALHSEPPIYSERLFLSIK